MANLKVVVGFHDALAASQAEVVPNENTDTKFNYTFENFFHPFVGELISKLNRDSLSGMLDARWQDGLKQPFFEAFYHPIISELVQVESFPKEISLEEFNKLELKYRELVEDDAVMNELGFGFRTGACQAGERAGG